jgi:hypothetical protein
MTRARPGDMSIDTHAGVDAKHETVMQVTTFARSGLHELYFLTSLIFCQFTPLRQKAIMDQRFSRHNLNTMRMNMKHNSMTDEGAI